jgi:murein DD-endopeptidase MepM/ murein hydrolase activator NlpD
MVTTSTIKTCTRLLACIVKSGDTFAGVLAKCNIPQNDISSYYALLRSTGFSALFPGDSIIITQEDNSNNKLFSLLSRYTYWYDVSHTDTSLHIERRPVELTRYTCVIKGTLLTSLSEDMALAGGDDVLALKFTDIFAWDINFFVDPRPGDKFQLVFEKYYREGMFAGYGNILAAEYTNGNRRHYAIGVPDGDGRMSYYDLDGKSVQKEFLKAPLRYSYISSRFTYSRKHPVLGFVRPHLGVDYAAAVGTPVYAAADGIVRFTGSKGGFGNMVEISHGASYQTLYGHLQRIEPRIQSGVHVKQGQFIGTVGSTGLATGSHLDYRMKIGNRFVNPFAVNAASKRGVSGEVKDLFMSLRNAYQSTLETRFSNEGYYVIDITTLGTPEVDCSRSIILTNAAYDTIPRS